MEERISIIILSSAIVIAIIFAIIFYSSWNQAQSQLQTANLNINNSASAFNSKLHNLFDQNVLLLIGSSRQSLDSSVSANASLTALQDNIKDIGNLLTPIYGSNSSELTSLLESQSAVFLNYSIELSDNDSNAITDLNKNAAAYEQATAIFWTSTDNPYPIFNQATMQQMITTQMKDVESAINAWNAGSYTSYYNDEATTYSDAGLYINTIGEGIIEQNPQDFR